MIFPRILAIIIIGGGYLIWNAIFQAFPIRKEYEQKPIFSWVFAFLIIIGQLYYVWFVFSRLAEYGDSMVIFLLVIKIVVSALILLLLLKRIRG